MPRQGADVFYFLEVELEELELEQGSELQPLLEPQLPELEVELELQQGSELQPLLEPQLPELEVELELQQGSELQPLLEPQLPELEVELELQKGSELQPLLEPQLPELEVEQVLQQGSELQPLLEHLLEEDWFGAVPLKSFEVELEVRDHVATVVSTLNYENKEDKPLEAVFVFPLPGDAAVCHFSAQVGQTQIVAELKEKQKARQEYDDALSSGSEGAGVQVTSVPASLVPYSLSFSARVSSPRPVSKVESNCSLDPLQYLNTDPTQATVKLAAGHKFDRDVELLIYYKDAHQPTAVVEAGQASAEPGSLMGDPVVMVSLYPEFPQVCDVFNGFMWRVCVLSGSIWKYGLSYE
ncbi:unnamed protein product [Oreochromis niloticus]|nr:unnamed protein product [Mustela putorius furo]